MATESAPHQARLRDAVVVALVAFVLFRWLGQETFYGPDGRAILKMTMSGMVAHPQHLLYVPMWRASHAVVSLWGGSWYDAGMLLSQAGPAVGVFFWHRAAAHLHATRVQAAAVVGLCVTAPAILFFASVVELHAPFVAFAGVATYAAARLSRRSSLLASVGLGMATGLAVGAHATGHLLLVWLLPLVWLHTRTGGRRRRLTLLALAVAVHACVTVALVLIFGALGADVHVGAAAEFLARGSDRRLQLQWVPSQVWVDWLRPFAPLSFVAVLGAWRDHGASAALLCGVVASLVATFLLMAPTTENGAYLLPLVFAAALLVVRTLPRWLWVATMLVGLTLGWRWIAAHENPTFGRAFVADVRALAADTPVELFCGQHREFDACMIFGPDIAWRELLNETSLPPEAVPTLIAGLREWVTLRQRDGRIVLITDGALEYLAAPVGVEQRTGPLLRQAIQREFRLEPVHGETLRAWRLVPRR